MRTRDPAPARVRGSAQAGDQHGQVPARCRNPARRQAEAQARCQSPARRPTAVARPASRCIEARGQSGWRNRGRLPGRGRHQARVRAPGRSLIQQGPAQTLDRSPAQGPAQIPDRSPAHGPAQTPDRVQIPIRRRLQAQARPRCHCRRPACGAAQGVGTGVGVSWSPTDHRKNDRGPLFTAPELTLAWRHLLHTRELGAPG
ncbi:hypothetical protein ALMP_51620 [Streptomyces sp. A012304]|nr:hypothetical protein ALMP_51620 [Streptomyces sp. A012304]